MSKVEENILLHFPLNTCYCHQGNQLEWNSGLQDVLVLCTLQSNWKSYTLSFIGVLFVSQDWYTPHSRTFRFSSAFSSAVLNIAHEESQCIHWHFHHIYSLSFPDYFLEILWILLSWNVYLAWGVHIYNSSVLMPSNIIMLQHNRLAIYLCHCWSTQT